ncbi:hypothetical protein C8F01DRAFT_1081375 [Mycena amicta]|nr:hypothetical protein C8F01DRAFT_1081375 [Mycena amicta]
MTNEGFPSAEEGKTLNCTFILRKETNRVQQIASFPASSSNGTRFRRQLASRRGRRGRWGETSSSGMINAGGGSRAIRKTSVQRDMKVLAGTNVQTKVVVSVMKYGGTSRLAGGQAEDVRQGTAWTEATVATMKSSDEGLEREHCRWGTHGTDSRGFLGSGVFIWRKKTPSQVAHATILQYRDNLTWRTFDWFESMGNIPRRRDRIAKVR